MSAKSLIRYRTQVGGQEDILSPGGQPPWPAPSEQSKQEKKSSLDNSESSSNNRLEEDSFDEGIDDILAQVNIYSLNFHSSQVTRTQIM